MGFEFEDLLKSVGDNGRYQKLLTCVFFIPVSTLIPMLYFGFIFMNSTPDHWCYVPEVASSNLSLDEQKLVIRPQNDQSCSTYEVDYSVLIRSRNLTVDERWPTKPCPHGWQFNKSNYDATAVTRWNMVCSDSRYSSLVLSLFFAGNVIGTPLFSHLSEKFGRRPIFFLLCVVTALTEIGSVLIPNFVLFLVLRAINGSSLTILFINSYVTVLEMVAIDVRSRINVIGTTFWSLGLCLLPLVAWLTRNWVSLSICLSTCSLALLLYWRYFPESPQWLISKSRFQESFQTLNKISMKNGMRIDESELMKEIKNLGDRIEQEKKENRNNSPLDLFKYKRLRRRFTLATITWMGISVPYYGLVVNLKNLWGNEFLNFFLMSVMELPSHAITWVCLEKVGRRWTSVGGLMTSAVACLLPTLLPKELPYVGVSASLLGKLGASSVCMTLYLQCPEFYPTPLRNSATSLTATIGLASTLCVPFIADMAAYGKHLPFLVFSLVSFVAALTASFLPETLNRALPQTLEDAEVFGKDDKYFSFNRKLPPDAKDTGHAGSTAESPNKLFQGFKDSIQQANAPERLSFKRPSDSVYSIS